MSSPTSPVPIPGLTTPSSDFNEEFKSAEGEGVESEMIGSSFGEERSSKKSSDESPPEIREPSLEVSGGSGVRQDGN